MSGMRMIRLSDEIRQRRPPDERVHDDRDHHHREQEVGAAPHCSVETAAPTRRDLDVVLVRRDRLVLGAVVLEDTLDVLEATDQQQVAEEDGQPERTLEQVEPKPSTPKQLPTPLATDAGIRMKIAVKSNERESRWSSPSALGDPLLFGDLAVGRPRQRLEPERHDSAEPHDPAHERNLHPALRPGRRLVA